MGRRQMLIVATSYGTRNMLSDFVIIISENDDLPLDTNPNGVMITMSAGLPMILPLTERLLNV